MPDIMMSFSEWKRMNPSAYGAAPEDGHKHEPLPSDIFADRHTSSAPHLHKLSPDRHSGAPEITSLSGFFEDEDNKLGSNLPPASTLTVGRDGKPLKTAMARAEASITKRLPRLR